MSFQVAIGMHRVIIIIIIIIVSLIIRLINTPQWNLNVDSLLSVQQRNANQLNVWVMLSLSQYQNAQ